MLEDFAGNGLGTARELNITPNLQSFSDSLSPLDTSDYYSFSLGSRSSFNLSLNGLSANADAELLNSNGEVLQTLAQLGTNSESLFTTLNAGSYYIKVYSGVEATTDYNLNLSATPNQDAILAQNWDALTGFGNSRFNTGVFTVGSSGQVSIDYLLDGGAYQGELAIFSLQGMDQFEGGLNEFIAEAARRALSNSDLGHVVVSDATEGARFHGSFSWEPDYNSGDYLGVKTFSMRPGDEFGVMLVPDSTVQGVFDTPFFDGETRPLFSLSTANRNDAFHVGQIVDVTGDGHTFAMEDLRVAGGSDRDYNDLVFHVQGATGTALSLDRVIDPSHEWRQTDMGQALIDYAKSDVTSSEPIASDPIVSPPTETNPVVTPRIRRLRRDTNPIVSQAVSLPLETNPCVTQPVSPPLETNPVVTSPVDSQPVSFNFPASSQPLVGVIDTGFSANNPDLDYSHITLGRDYVSGDANPLLQPGEGNEHGTAILGIIGATQNNGIGIDGINDQAPLWVSRAIGSGQWADSLFEFVDTAKEFGQPNAIVNLSFDLTKINLDGSVSPRYRLTWEERLALTYAEQNNVMVVAAAGNQGGAISALGRASSEFDNIIVVGATDGLVRADYSNYGFNLHIVAPGGTAENPVLSTMGNNVGTALGTSVAAAQVTGAASQVWAANPQLNSRQVIQILETTATDIGTPGWDVETGAGLLNMTAAVSLAETTTPKPYTPQGFDFFQNWLQRNQVPEKFLPLLYESYYYGDLLNKLTGPTWKGRGNAIAAEQAAWWNPLDGIKDLGKKAANFITKNSDTIHTVLDVAGFIPVVGTAADLINAGLYAAQGDYVNAGLSLVSAVPVIGDAAGALGKGGKVLGKAVTKGGKVLGKAVTKGGKALGQAVTKSGKVLGKAVTKGGKALGQAVTKGGKSIGKVVTQFGGKNSAKLSRSITKNSAKLGRSITKNSAKLGRSITKNSAKLGRSITRNSASLGRSITRNSTRLDKLAPKIKNLDNNPVFKTIKEILEFKTRFELLDKLRESLEEMVQESRRQEEEARRQREQEDLRRQQEQEALLQRQEEELRQQGISVFTNPANGHKYFLTTPGTWTNAQAQAVAAGGNLVTINDAAEQAWLGSTFGSNQSFWIGLTDSEQYGTTEGNFKWVSGQPITYTNWWPGEPNNKLDTPEGEDFGEMRPSFAWNDLPNDSRFIQRGIVEIEANLPSQNQNNGSSSNVSSSNSSSGANTVISINASSLP